MKHTIKHSCGHEVEYDLPRASLKINTAVMTQHPCEACQETLDDVAPILYSHVFANPDTCPDGEEHDWTGPEVSNGIDTCVSCVRCGLPFAVWGMRNLP